MTAAQHAAKLVMAQMFPDATRTVRKFKVIVDGQVAVVTAGDSVEAVALAQRLGHLSGMLDEEPSNYAKGGPK